MIIQAVAESTVTFHCESRTWKKKEIREMQKIVDQEYRYVWMKNKKGPHQKQVEERKVNMYGVRRSL